MAMVTGKIIKGIGGFYYVKTADDQIYECRARGLLRLKKIKPLVGDNCEIEVISSDDMTGNVINILARKNELIRPAVANTDQAIVIFAIKYPDISLGLMDRFLINMELQDIDTHIVINKTDLDHDKAERIAQIYKDAGYDVTLTSCISGEGVEALRELCRDKTSLFSGPSGAGKSSLINAVCGREASRAGEISRKIKRGKNTTRETEYIGADEGTSVIDSPGFSASEVPSMEPGELMLYFREMASLKGKCRFSGCLHISEPDCAVKEAVEKGTISEERYISYKQICTDLKERKKW